MMEFSRFGLKFKTILKNSKEDFGWKLPGKGSLSGFPAGKDEGLWLSTGGRPGAGQEHLPVRNWLRP